MFLRSYSTKPPLKLVAELRKLTEVPITKAREALAASNNDVSAALDWLQHDLAISGAKKAAKVAHRAAREGLVGASVLSRGRGTTTTGSSSPSPSSSSGGVRAALVELNCETDFVARNALFRSLVADVAHTAAFFAGEGQGPADPEQHPRQHHTHTYMRPIVPREQLLDAPLLSAAAPGTTTTMTTVGSAIRDAIAKLGENIVLQRALSVVVHDDAVLPPSDGFGGLRLASYAHGGGGGGGGVESSTASTLVSQGRIGALALIALRSRRLPTLLRTRDFCEQLERIERALARQIVGFDTLAIRGEEDEEGGGGALYDQPFMMFRDALEGETVGAGLARWAREKQLVLDADGADARGLEVVEFVKWTVGESSDEA
ncbi:hypothetical protein BJV74DRAFT_946750 [Russula compacta]|nr:hypothetical protein BJV74DRAFT_946750 [Russula compacta]